MPQPLSEILLVMMPGVSRQTLKQMLRHSRVMVGTQVARRLDQVVENAADVKVLPRSHVVAGIGLLERVHEDRDVLVVYKPPGLLTSTVPGELRETAFKLVQQYVGARRFVGLIHRLDRDACGLLVFALSRGAMASLKGQFFRHSVQREYLAVVGGSPRVRKGTIREKLLERTDGRVIISRSVKATSATTHFRVLKTAKTPEGKTLSLIEFTLETGRKHQIRAHAAYMGCPIVNDEMYLGPKIEGLPMMLMAVRLAFAHPSRIEPGMDGSATDHDGEPVKFDISDRFMAMVANYPWQEPPHED